MRGTGEQTLKYKLVYDEIIRGLTSGRYRVGDRLPSERALAERLNVNIVTVRRGYRELTFAGIVEKKVGSGAYLRQALDAKPAEKTVTFVLSPQIWSTVSDFLKLIPDVMRMHKRNYRFIMTDSNDFQNQIQSNIEYGMPTVFLAGLPLPAEQLISSRHLFVVMSRRADQEGIPSILCDDTLGVRLLMDHLRSLGHKRIALLRSNTPDETIQSAAWQSGMESDFAPDLVIPLKKLNEDFQEEPMDLAREAVARICKDLDFTALLCLNEELAVGAIAGLSSRGLRIPDDVAVVSIGNTPLTRNMVPALTVYDPDIRAHLEQALAMLDYNMTHPDDPEMLRLIRPRLLVRGSSGVIREPKRKGLSR